MKHPLVLALLCACCAICSAEVSPSAALKMAKQVYDKCTTTEEMLKCLKIQALKVVDRALHSKALNIVEGITLVEEEGRTGRSGSWGVPLNETKLEKLKSEEIDNLLVDNTARFFDTHKLKIDVPKLVEEGRGKKKEQSYGALMWALAIKGSFLAMAYQGIAVMSGTALIVGKMALLLAAILGLKKLVSSGHEKTTIEVVKQPKYSETNTHSTSYEDEGHYRRSVDFDEFGRRTSPYRGHIPNV